MAGTSEYRCEHVRERDGARCMLREDHVDYDTDHEYRPQAWCVKCRRRKPAAGAYKCPGCQGRGRVAQFPYNHPLPRRRNSSREAREAREAARLRERRYLIAEAAERLRRRRGE